MKSRSLLKKIIFSLALAVGLALGIAAVCSFASIEGEGDIVKNGIKYHYLILQEQSNVGSFEITGAYITSITTAATNETNSTDTCYGDSFSEGIFTFPNEIKYGQEYNTANVVGFLYNCFKNFTDKINIETVILPPNLMSCHGCSYTQGAPAGMEFTYSPSNTPFNELENLKEISFSSSVTTDGNGIQDNGYYFCKNGVLYGYKSNQVDKELYKYPSAKTDTIFDFDGIDVKTVWGQTFYKVKNLKKVIFPATVNKVSSGSNTAYLFRSCDNLESIIFLSDPNLSTSDRLCRYCNKLEKIFAPTGSKVGKTFQSGGTGACTTIKYEYDISSVTNKAQITSATVFYTGTDTSETGKVNCNDLMNYYAINSVDETVNVTLQHPPIGLEAAQPATCTEPGHVEGYVCYCGEKAFADSAATRPIAQADWEIAALGHLLTEHLEQAATCSATGNVHYWSCGRSACLKKFSDADATTEITDVTIAIDPNAHNWGAPEYTWQPQSGNTLNGSVNYVCTHNNEHTKSDPVELTVYSGTYDRNEHTGVTISSNPTEEKIEFSQDNGATWDEDIPIYTDAGTYNLSVRFAGQEDSYYYGTATVNISPINISDATLTISFNGIISPNIPIYNGLVQVPDNISFELSGSGNIYIVKGSV